MPDIEPFAIEPLLLARLHRAKVGPGKAAVIFAIIIGVCVTWSALIPDLFYASNPKTWWTDLGSFLLHKRTTAPSRSVSYLNDYPSIIITVMIAVTFYLVYALFCWAAVLHSDMAKANCIRYTPQGHAQLTAAVNGMNARFAKWGKFAPLAFAIVLASALTLNFRLEGRLFTFLGKGDLYANWWASLHPFRVGAISWIFFGSIGIYLVYVEAILGLSYVKFVRGGREAYQFRANMLNPDGLFGWSRLRAIISDLEAGVLCTLITSWALSFYLQPSVGAVVTGIIITIFGAIVLYVFISLSLNFRRQVRADKDAQRTEIGQMISQRGASSDVESLLGTLVAYKQLELVSKIPSSPVRQGWLVVGAVTLVIPVVALVIQLLSYMGGH